MVSETKTTEAPGLRRELKARHLTMIAIGGSIGTGLFCCLWRNDFSGRSGRGIALVYVDWPDGLLPDDQSR